MKIVADKVTQSTFEIKCPKCGHIHEFERCTVDKYFVQPDELDTFTIDNNGHVWPDFVCRNSKCNFSDSLMIINLILS